MISKYPLIFLSALIIPQSRLFNKADVIFLLHEKEVLDQSSCAELQLLSVNFLFLVQNQLYSLQILAVVDDVAETEQ
jgi:hypothetical protein